MSYKDWYTIFEQADKFIVQKVDPDDHSPQTAQPALGIANQYTISKEGGNKAMCTCFAGHNWCRHKKMLVKFQQMNRINSRWLYNFDKDKWISPMVEVIEEA